MISGFGPVDILILISIIAFDILLLFIYHYYTKDEWLRETKSAP
jgi:hypothetical protein